MRRVEDYLCRDDDLPPVVYRAMPMLPEALWVEVLLKLREAQPQAWRSDRWILAAMACCTELRHVAVSPVLWERRAKDLGLLDAPSNEDMDPYQAVTRAWMDYWDAMSTVPPPTSTQITNFVRHVGGAHCIDRDCTIDCTDTCMYSVV